MDANLDALRELQSEAVRAVAAIEEGTAPGMVARASHKVTEHVDEIAELLRQLEQDSARLKSLARREVKKRVKRYADVAEAYDVSQKQLRSAVHSFMQPNAPTAAFALLPEFVEYDLPSGFETVSADPGFESLGPVGRVIAELPSPEHSDMVVLPRIYNAYLPKPNTVRVHLRHADGTDAELADPEDEIEIVLEREGVVLDPSPIVVSNSGPGQYVIQFSIDAAATQEKDVQAMLRVDMVPFASWTMSKYLPGFALRKCAHDQFASLVAELREPLGYIEIDEYFYGGEDLVPSTVARGPAALQIIRSVLNWYGIPNTHDTDTSTFNPFREIGFEPLHAFVISRTGRKESITINAVRDEVEADFQPFNFEGAYLAPVPYDGPFWFTLNKFGRLSVENEFPAFVKELTRVLRLAVDQPTIEQAWQVCPSTLLIEDPAGLNAADDGVTVWHTTVQYPSLFLQGTCNEKSLGSLRRADADTKTSIETAFRDSLNKLDSAPEKSYLNCVQVIQIAMALTRLGVALDLHAIGAKMPTLLRAALFRFANPALK